MTDGDRLNLNNKNPSTPEKRMDDVVENNIEDVDESLGLEEVQGRSKINGTGSSYTRNWRKVEDSIECSAQALGVLTTKSFRKARKS